MGMTDLAVDQQKFVIPQVGRQVAVFGRKGSRPLNLQEMRQLYLDDDGNPWVVKEDVPEQASQAERGDDDESMVSAQAAGQD